MQIILIEAQWSILRLRRRCSNRIESKVEPAKLISAQKHIVVEHKVGM